MSLDIKNPEEFSIPCNEPFLTKREPENTASCKADLTVHCKMMIFVKCLS